VIRRREGHYGAGGRLSYTNAVRATWHQPHARTSVLPMQRRHRLTWHTRT